MSKASSSTGGESWQNVVLARMRARNAVQCDAFRGIVAQHENLYTLNRALQRRNDDLAKELTILRHEMGAAAIDDGSTGGGAGGGAAGGGGGGGGAGGAKAVKGAQKLQRQVHSLQEQLTKKYKTEAESATSRLQLTTQVQDLTRKLQQHRADLAASRAELRAAGTLNAPMPSFRLILRRSVRTRKSFGAIC